MLFFSLPVYNGTQFLACFMQLVEKQSRDKKGESEKEEEQRGSQPIERLPYYSSGSLANTTVISLAPIED